LRSEVLQDEFRTGSQRTPTNGRRHSSAAIKILDHDIPMKLLSAFVTALLALTPTAMCLAQTQAQERQACDVKVDITDTDPKGTNVRASPGGAVIASLSNPNVEGWIAAHVTGQLGDWYEIDRASLINADFGPDGKAIFHGKGFLHKSVVGVSGMQNGGAIYRDHDIRSDLIDPHAPGEQKVDLLGCWGEFLKIHVRKGSGWTREACTNMDTTCS
jgi:hypothetical protein